MGLSLFSGSPDEPYTQTTRTAPNPNKYRFNVIRTEDVGGQTLVWANYPDCTTYGGNKIILVEGWHTQSNELDPHFIENLSYKVVARFQPTEAGWRIGMEVARSLA